MSIRREAVERLARGVANAVDDWGWKGGKPGELTGRMYDELWVALRRGRTDALSPESKAWLGDKPYRSSRRFSENDLYDVATAQLRKSKVLADRAENFTTDDVMDDFRILEDHDIPREWTGKIAKALPPMREWKRLPAFFQDQPDFNFDVAAGELSDLMRSMTNDQRRAFLALLPKSTRSLEETAAAAKKLYRR
jgi:hypothetical protein